MSSQVTITADLGPGLEVTAIVITNVTRINYDLSGMSVAITSEGKVQTFSLTGITTVTTTVAAAGYTVVIS